MGERRCHQPLSPIWGAEVGGGGLSLFNTPPLFLVPTVPHGLLGPGPMANGFPPGPKAMQHFPPGGPMPGK